MIVYKTQMNIFSSPVIHKDPGTVLEDVRMFLTETASYGDRFIIMVESISEEEFEKLPEFQGY
jgi:hypothetical protein